MSKEIVDLRALLSGETERQGSDYEGTEPLSREEALDYFSTSKEMLDGKSRVFRTFHFRGFLQSHDVLSKADSMSKKLEELIEETVKFLYGDGDELLDAPESGGGDDAEDEKPDKEEKPSGGRRRRSQTKKTEEKAETKDEKPSGGRRRRSRRSSSKDEEKPEEKTSTRGRRRTSTSSKKDEEKTEPAETTDDPVVNEIVSRLEAIDSALDSAIDLITVQGKAIDKLVKAVGKGVNVDLDPVLSEIADLHQDVFVTSKLSEEIALGNQLSEKELDEVIDNAIEEFESNSGDQGNGD